jgi:hypothetical protein
VEVSKEPFSANHGEVLSRFDATGNSSQTGEVLLRTTLGNPFIPTAYLCWATLNNAQQPRVYVIHLVSKFHPSLVLRVTPWDNRIFCFLGDIIQGMIATVAIPTTAFDLSPETWTYNEATLITELPNRPQDNFFPYMAPNTANTEELRTWLLMYLPGKYAALLLSSRGYTVKQAWDILQPAIEANNEVRTMQPILNWLRITLHASHINNQGPPTTAIAITAPCPDDDLILHREPYLITFLPGRADATNPGLDTTIAQMATAVRQQVAETRTT